MAARLTQEFVDEWLAENRPLFKPDEGWVYVGNKTPIPGVCLAEGCGARCAPRLNNMKDFDKGHCDACGSRVAGAKNSVLQRAHGEAEIRRVAAERDFEVVKVFSKRLKHSGHASGFEEKTYATLRCGCGNVWSAVQSSLCSSGHGCPTCAEHGYDSAKPGAIYLLARSVDGIDQRGYGISNDWSTRVAGYKRYGWLPLDVMEFATGAEARELETRMNRLVAEIAPGTVPPDALKYKNKEAFADGHGIPMFTTVAEMLSWLEAQGAAREVLI